MSTFDPLSDVFKTDPADSTVDTTDPNALDAAVAVEKTKAPDFDFFAPAAAQKAVVQGSAATPEVLNIGDLAPNDFGASKYDKDITTPEQMFDLEEHRGQSQTTADKWANGGLKFVGKTATNVVGGIAGVAWGAVTAPWGGFSRIWDNEVLHGLDDANEWMDGKLPNYYTKAEREKGLFNQMGTANFWSDQFLNGLSFLAGAVLTEAVSALGGPAAVAGNTARITAQATRLFKTVGMLTKASTKATTMQAANIAKWTGRIDDTFVLGRQIMTGAGYEAGVEARHSYEAIRDNLITAEIGDHIASTEEALGRSLTLEEKAELLTPAQKQNIDDRATELSNTVFMGNLALVGYSNMLMLPKLYGPGIGKSMASIPNKIGTAERIAGKVGMGARGADNLRIAGKMGYNAFYEGVVEEGGQGALHTAAEDYALVNGLSDQGQTGNMLVDVMNSFGEGMAKTYQTKEGQTEVMIGMMLGLTGFGGIGKYSTFGQAKAEVEDRRSIVDLVERMSKENPSLLNSVRQNALFFNNVMKRADLYDAALDAGDVNTAKNLEFDNFFDFVHAKLQTGQFEDVAKQSKEILALSDEEFVEFAGYKNEELTSEEIGARKAEVVKRVNDRAVAIKEATEKVDKNLRLSETARLLNSGTVGSDAYMRRQLIHSIASMDNADEREKDMVAQLATLTKGKVKGNDFDVDSIEYTDKDGNVKEVRIGEFDKANSLGDEIESRLHEELQI